MSQKEMALSDTPKPPGKFARPIKDTDVWNRITLKCIYPHHLDPNREEHKRAFEDGLVNWKTHLVPNVVITSNYKEEEENSEDDDDDGTIEENVRI